MYVRVRCSICAPTEMGGAVNLRTPLTRQHTDPTITSPLFLKDNNNHNIVYIYMPTCTAPPLPPSPPATAALSSWLRSASSLALLSLFPRALACAARAAASALVEAAAVTRISWRVPLSSSCVFYLCMYVCIYVWFIFWEGVCTCACKCIKRHGHRHTYNLLSPTTFTQPTHTTHAHIRIYLFIFTCV